MRGQSLFAELQVEPDKGVAVATRKGRNEERMEERDQMLCIRYLYYITHTDLRLEKIKENLSNEFFLSPRRIEDIFSEQAAYLRSLRKELFGIAKPLSLSKLRSLYPHWVWPSSK